ncbi:MULTISPECIES: hypothetical protein [unclassified Crossiella]|uniref:hypothetical protein n=1 Tax=unclassified Crossiella TaxID=2620835 RepID=UPI001FFF3CC7|nr:MULTISPECIES: hypothetical protein [unclassified Crossiella]MCK2243987.1 hypothetical protein [Crossiella sp. S99.2]MCK2257155.1 hypothetical protein [Crossiella sp. S99.1]
MSIDFGGDGRFVVEVAELDGLIRGLSEARDAIVKINRDVKRSLDVGIPPSEDPYSPDAMRKIIECAVKSGSGDHSSANQVYQEVVQQMIDKLAAAKQQYARAEGTNRSAVEGKG